MIDPVLFSHRIPITRINAFSDAVIALAYVSISLMLTYLVKRRRDLPFPMLFLFLMGALFACGTVRVIDVWAFWHPSLLGPLSVVARGTAAGLSSLAAVLMFLVIPKAIGMRSPSELDLELQKLGGIVASSNEAIIRGDLNGKIEKWNAAAERLYGYPEHEVIGKSMSILDPPHHDLQLTAILNALKHNPRTVHYETRHVNRSRDLIDVAFSVSPVYENAQLVGAAMIARDNRERLRLLDTERRYTKRLELIHRLDRMILEREPTNTCAKLILEFMDSLGAFSRMTVVSPWFESGKYIELIDYTNGKFTENTERSWLPFADTPFAATFQQGSMHIVDLSCFGDIPELSPHKIAGSRFVCHSKMIVRGEVIGSLNLAAATADVFTEEILDHIRELSVQLAVLIQQESLWKKIDQHAVELEEKVEERTRELKEVNSALEAFSYSVSHDLRAPLRTMQGFTEALLEDYSAQLDATGQDYARRIAEGAGRLDRLIQDLLRYNRIGQSKIDSCAVDLGKIVDEILEELAADLDRQGAKVNIDDPLPVVLGHPGTLSQVFSNLIGNAVKFVRPGQKSLVRVKTEPSAKGTVRIWVEDNGIGIEPKHKDRVFQIFERLDAAYSGTGIGLAIVRKGVERMGGQVGLISQLGEGSRFWVEMPKPAEVQL